MTLLTIVPLASGARGLTAGPQGLLQIGTRPTTSALMYQATNRALMGTLSVATSAAGMAAADSIPGLTDGQCSALRLTLGVAGGVAPGIVAAYGPAMMRSATIRLTRGVVLLRTRIAALKDQIKALTAGAAKEALKTEQALTERLAATVQQRIEEIWAKGGADLAAADTANKTAAAELRRLVEKANTPGISPAEQAALLTGRELKEAQQALAASERKLMEEFGKAERKWWEANRGAFPTGSPRDYAPRVLARSQLPHREVAIVPPARTPNLPNQISLEELHRIRGVPGSQGIDLTPGSIDLRVYRRMWDLSEYYGIEYGLAQVQRPNGTLIWRLYSGSGRRVTYGLQPGERIVRFGGHTHPSGSPDPSYFFSEALGRTVGDVETLNRLWAEMGYTGQMPHSRVIYGPNRIDTTMYYPNEGR